MALQDVPDGDGELAGDSHGRLVPPAAQGIEGLLLNKKVFVINTRGVDFNNDHMKDMDQLKPYLKAIFAFVGLTDLTFIDVSPVQFSEAEARENAINRGKEEIVRIVKSLKSIA